MLFTLCSGAFALFFRRANYASLGLAVLLCLVFIQAPEGVQIKADAVQIQPNCRFEDGRKHAQPPERGDDGPRVDAPIARSRVGGRRQIRSVRSAATFAAGRGGGTAIPVRLGGVSLRSVAQC